MSKPGATCQTTRDKHCFLLTVSVEMRVNLFYGGKQRKQIALSVKWVKNSLEVVGEKVLSS